MASGRKAKLAEVAGNDRFQIECNEFLQHHSPDSCIGDVEMIAPVAHENCVGTRSGVANWRFDNLVIWRLALSGQIGRRSRHTKGVAVRTGTPQICLVRR